MNRSRLGLTAVLIANCVCVEPGGVLAQGVPLPPKKPPQTVVRPRPPIAAEAAIRPGPVRRPAKSSPYDGSQRRWSIASALICRACRR